MISQILIWNCMGNSKITPNAFLLSPNILCKVAIKWFTVLPIEIINLPSHNFLKLNFSCLHSISIIFSYTLKEIICM